MPNLTITLLGSPKIFLNGELRSFRTRKAVALVAYLAVTQQIHRRESLVTLFWPESDTARGKSSLRQTLARLRKALGGDWFDIQRQTVGLNVEADIRVDVLRFRELLVVESLAAHEEAIQLYHGDFMTGLALRDSPLFDEWQYFEQESLRQSLAGAVETAVSLHTQNNQYDQAIPHAQRLVALDTLNEAAQQQLMRLYAQTGQRAAAIQQYESFCAILEEELGVEPEQETISLHDDIIHNRYFVAKPESAQMVEEATKPENEPNSPRPRHNLPSVPTSFVGRETELTEIASLLATPECRLVSLIGLGGIGKTRLAVQTAVSQLDHFADGVWLVDLAPIQSVHFLPTAVATALGLTFEGVEEPQKQLAAFLRDKEMLLLFDNFEHLLDGAELVSYLMGQAPQLKALVTSREQLRLAEEWSYDVGGLPYPDEVLPQADVPQRNLLVGKTAVSYSAVQLFTQRARQAQHNFSLVKEERDVIRICHLVEGMPLGLELAAAWVRMLSCAQIAREIGQSLDFLATDQRNVIDRHRSIRAVFEYSWQMLSPTEQDVLAQLSIFRGGFTQEAAAEVADASIFVLYSLLNKSLLRRNASGRYEMHELLRQFAADKLIEPKDTAKNHCHYFSSWLHASEANLFDEHQTETLNLISEELENIYHAWLWAAEQGDLVSLDQAVHSLYNYHAIRSLNEQGYQIFKQALLYVESYLHVTSITNNSVVIRMMARQSEFLRMLGKQLEAMEILNQALTLAQQMQLPKEEIVCHLNLGLIANSLGNYSQGKTHLMAAYSLANTEGDRHNGANAIMTLGTIEQALGNFAEAKEMHQRCLSWYTQLGYDFGLAHAERLLGLTSFHLGAYEEARAYYQGSLDKFETIHNEIGIALVFTHLGDLMTTLGKIDQAGEFYREGLLHSKRCMAPAIEAISLHSAGRFLLATGQMQEGEQYLYHALKTAVAIHKTPLTLDILLDMALQLESVNYKVRPQEIILLVKRHSASTWEAQKKVEQA
ncbi:MAG: BTAD domain-containing putative transcriptional regulator, partial [Chloroflexota bacterium]